MKSKITSVIFSIFVGAFLGSLIAMELNKYFQHEIGSVAGSLCGAIIGAIVGYIGYEPSSFFVGLRSAFIDAYAGLVSAASAVLRHIPELLSVVRDVCCALAYMILIPIVSVCCYVYLEDEGVLDDAFKSLVFASYVSVSFAGIALFVGNIAKLSEISPGQLLLVRISPILAAVSPIWLLLLAIVIAVQFAILLSYSVYVSVVAPFPRFVSLAYQNVHSEARYVCGIWAMIGSVIGLCTNSALIGAIIATVLGVLDYKYLSRTILPRLRNI